jgi:cell wall-associated NlpC family hydrolase
MGCLTLLLMTAVCCVGPLNMMLSAGSGTAAGDVTGAEAGIPERMLAAYRSAAANVPEFAPKCQGMRWQVLAGIAMIESKNATGHTITAAGDITPHIVGPRLDGSGAGGNTTAVRDTDGGKWDGDTVYDRAVGPFQFLPATFRASGKDGNADGKVDPHNADDSAPTAAVYLCGTGRNLTDRGQLSQAIYGYNHSDAYVSDVMSWIDHYDALTGSTDLSGFTGTAQKVLQAALAQKGVPYSWGGGNATGPSRGICCSPGGQDGRTVVGFDCSGLTLYAFTAAGVRLPRTAAAQAGVGTRIPASAGVAALEPGDLVFYGYIPTADSTIHHVGIYLGGDQMINAAKPGTTVRLDSVTSMADYAGGARIL